MYQNNGFSCQVNLGIKGIQTQGSHPSTNQTHLCVMERQASSVQILSISRDFSYLIPRNNLLPDNGVLPLPVSHWTGGCTRSTSLLPSVQISSQPGAAWMAVKTMQVKLSQCRNHLCAFWGHLHAWCVFVLVWMFVAWIGMSHSFR